ncbi:uncharacterized protein LOC128518474 [Clarias gariepinus]|uniref:uncharacterized protein LOC128518474 n=1 Tax=Clarias gariepinus TaxID=13013 RepID=UPI00234C4952|nr:uncharacterized protein LOC128518474 [Clarias gariepinus]XP_053347579.1 uncharacterized protein LOC128518474 [Clarias gariepinus]XP_053347580.1 uncharacterized protein LOC128518474 [Clarias gariepinus]
MPSGSNVLQFFMMKLGNTLGVETDVIKRLENRLSLREVSLEEECDVIIAFVPVASRAGTDIEAALLKIKTSRPVILAVLHHTFDTDYIAPDSKYCVKREGVLAVDLLFNEDLGLLRSLRNDVALKSITDCLISMSASPDAPVVGVGQLTQKTTSNIISQHRSVQVRPHQPDLTHRSRPRLSKRGVHLAIVLMLIIILFILLFLWVFKLKAH